MTDRDGPVSTPEVPPITDTSKGNERRQPKGGEEEESKKGGKVNEGKGTPLTRL